MRPSLLRLTVAVGAAATVQAFAAPARGADATYGGQMVSGDPIVIKADPKATTLKEVVISWRATCADGSWEPGGGPLRTAARAPGFVPDPFELLMAKNAKGAFRGTQKLITNSGVAIVDVQGKLKPRRASGTLVATLQLFDPATGAAIGSCRTRQSWAATREPGIIYGGATSQGLPLVVRLDKARTRVKDVMTTWLANCASGGYLRAPDHFIDFPVKRTGGFGNPFSFDVSLDAGAKRTFAFTLAGRLTSKAVKGTLQVKTTDTDAAGAPAETCDSGALTWNASTG